MADKALLFCSRCGNKCKSGDKFCSSCGSSVAQNTTQEASCSSNASRSISTPKSTISLEEFRKRKEACRSSHFLPKSKKKKTQRKSEENVTITVGIMRLCNGSTLKKERGSNMAITISTSSNHLAILERAIAKHARFNKSFNAHLKYTLLYPDASEVKEFLPDSNEPFVLEKYKDELGKPYSRVTLFICRVTDYFTAASASLLQSDIQDSDDSDFDYPNVESSVEPSNTYVSTCNELFQDQPCSSSTSSIPSNELDNRENNEDSCDTSLEHVPVVPQKVECPTCSQFFNINEIAEHADFCVDIWVGEVEHCVIQEEEQGSEEIHESDEENIKIILKKMADSELSGQARINVRRSHIWNDFKDARNKKRVKPNNMIKVVFIGEPAVDDGGPRREFFSGMFLLFYPVI